MMNSTPQYAWTPRPVAEVVSKLLPEKQIRREVEALEVQLPEIVKTYEDSGSSIRQNLKELLAILRTSDQTVKTMASRGFFKTQWARLMGKEAREAKHIRANLVRAQARAICVIDRLMERQEYLQLATQYLGARLELLAMENVKLKEALIHLGTRVFDRIENLEERVQSLEQRVDLIEYFQSCFCESLRQPYEQIEDPLIRTLLLCKDFLEKTGGAWRSVDLHRFKEVAETRARLSPSVVLEVRGIVQRAIELFNKGPYHDLLTWLQNGDLYGRLMASVKEGADETRALYPVHFLMLRPYWFVFEQGFAVDQQKAVEKNIGDCGLNLETELSPWKLTQMLLEERLAWSIEQSTFDGPEESPRSASLGDARKIDRQTQDRIFDSLNDKNFTYECRRPGFVASGEIKFLHNRKVKITGVQGLDDKEFGLVLDSFEEIGQKQCVARLKVKNYPDGERYFGAISVFGALKAALSKGEAHFIRVGFDLSD